LPSFLENIFPGIGYSPVGLDKLKEHIWPVAAESYLDARDVWFQKFVSLGLYGENRTQDGGKLNVIVGKE
jgi:hypothetical protein